MKKEKVIVKNIEGLHIRPASELAKVTNQFKCDIQITVGERRANAKSILGIMSAGAKANDEIEFACEGEDEETAINEIVKVFTKVI